MILVGVDFSDGASAAVECGRRLAATNGGPLKFVHVTRDPVEGWSPGEGEKDWLRALWMVPWDVDLRRGVPWVELVRAAEEWTASLVVAGTHGTTGFQPFRLGKTASEVALHCRAPVVLVPTVNHRRRDRIENAIATDDKEQV